MSIVEFIFLGIIISVISLTIVKIYKTNKEVEALLELKREMTELSINVLELKKLIAEREMIKLEEELKLLEEVDKQYNDVMERSLKTLDGEYGEE